MLAGMKTLRMVLLCLLLAVPLMVVIGIAAWVWEPWNLDPRMPTKADVPGVGQVDLWKKYEPTAQEKQKVSLFLGKLTNKPRGLKVYEAAWVLHWRFDHPTRLWHVSFVAGPEDPTGRLGRRHWVFDLGPSRPEHEHFDAPMGRVVDPEEDWLQRWKARYHKRVFIDKWP